MFKTVIGIIAVSLVSFGCWYYFIDHGNFRSLNDEFIADWDRIEGTAKEQPKTEEPKVTEESKPATQQESDIPLPVRKPTTATLPPTSKPNTSRNPMVLSNRRNYITGDEVTYIVPDDMRTLQLNIQESNGRAVSSYTLPNAFIGIKPKQRIQLKVNH